MSRKQIAAAIVAAAMMAQPMLAEAQTGGNPAATAGKAAGMSPGQMPDMGAMSEMMKKMQAQMDKIRQTADPKERENLLDEHMKSMQEAMQGMRGMGGPMMGMAAGSGRRPGPDRRMQMMEQRMDMMQMMMEQMMQHEQMMSRPAPSK